MPTLRQLEYLVAVAETRHFRRAAEKVHVTQSTLSLQLQALEEGDLKPEHVKAIATKLGVSEADVISMNRRLGGDASLNAPVRADQESGEWQDWLADDSPDQEERLVEAEENGNPECNAGHRSVGEHALLADVQNGQKYPPTR